MYLTTVTLGNAIKFENVPKMTGHKRETNLVLSESIRCKYYGRHE